MDESSVLEAVIRDITDQKLVEAIEENLTGGSPENPRPWTRASDLSLELARMLDPHLEEVDRLLAWLPHRARCDENIKKAESIIAETSGLQPEWMAQLKALCTMYEVACARHDRRESDHIAFGLIPAHFETDEQLRRRVGKRLVDDVATSDRTVSGHDVKGTIKRA
jgi:hypothetical protein